MNSSVDQILLQPLQMGDIQLKNRICMAALTRQRCENPDLVPTDLHVQYYTQRAAAGFILTECSPVSNRSISFPGAAGIFTDEQAQGWKRVIDSVHQQGGKIIMQIWHSGRATHSDLQNGLVPWAPSAIAIRGLNTRAKKDQQVPHEMTIEEIQEVVAQFRAGAERAKQAGFDGLQLHGAHGYLVDQFLRTSSNKRTDLYGGSVENRSRFCLEVLDQLIEVFGSGRVGIKVSPAGAFGDMNDEDPISLYTYLFQEFEKRKIAFIELKNDQDPENVMGYGYPASKTQVPNIYKAFRPLFSGVIVGNNLYTPETATQEIKEGNFDAVTFGRLFITNPDLVDRVKNNYPLNQEFNYKTFYSQGPVGYTDYPVYESQ